MKICITSQGDNAESQVDPRFGRCAYFIIADTETSAVEAVKNSYSSTGGGAGIQSGQLMSEKDIKAVLTGNVGPNAFQTLKAAGIDIFTGVSGIVSDVIERYKKGEYKPVDASTVESHFGMKGGL
ncbi:MAG: NifB/NifX family molybdenum-iron cluster-binding protein [Spirochaetales bacterium]|nr:NifB/NifX family molybdenum-iron cluster-binding protein [Spirochaetales bacterium]